MGPFEDPKMRIGGVDPLPFLETGGQTDLDRDELLGGVADSAGG